MQLLLPLAVEKGVCNITNMGSTNTLAAQEKVLEIASRLGIKITVGVAHQFDIAKAGLCSNLRNLNDGISMYPGAAPIDLWNVLRSTISRWRPLASPFPSRIPPATPNP
ncbi:putative acyclic terpene utilization [Helianthus annuus]|nr:putative acyclic terpene utilization [Helianthus annuus]